MYSPTVRVSVKNAHIQYYIVTAFIKKLGNLEIQDMKTYSDRYLLNHECYITFENGNNPEGDFCDVTKKSADG